MKASIVAEANRLVFSVSGELSFSDNKKWRELSEEMLAKDATTYVLDVTQLSMVDSAGLGMMLTVQKWAEDKGHTLRLRYDESTVVGSMIKLAKFNEMFEPDV
jgi:anti-anti-sigma factor